MSTPRRHRSNLPARAELCQYPAMSRLILFDIDGTLTRTKNGYIPFNEALLQTFGHEGDIRLVIPDGNTDPLIVQDIFAKASVALSIGEHDWSRFSIILRDRYHYHVRRGTTSITALPGTAELLKRIASTPALRASVVTASTADGTCGASGRWFSENQVRPPTPSQMESADRSHAGDPKFTHL